MLLGYLLRNFWYFLALRWREKAQWRNDAPAAPATPGGAVLRGRQIVIKMWDNFARLTARLAKSRVLFNNSTIYLDFSAIFSQIVPNRLLNEGRPLGATFCRRGATSWLSLQRYATVWRTHKLCRSPWKWLRLWQILCRGFSGSVQQCQKSIWDPK